MAEGTKKRPKVKKCDIMLCDQRETVRGRVMDIFKKVFLILGAAFIGVGGIVSTVFIGVGGMGIFVVIPLFFVVLGIVFLVSGLRMGREQKEIAAKGDRYKAKIYSYVEDKSFVVNGDYTVNVKVHYFDKTGIEREAILPTGFAKGSSEYPIGMTIDIFEYQGKYSFDPKSVRNEVLFGEEELMDDKPIDPELIKLTAIKCPSCGSSFQAVKGYTAKCPYCSGYLNA